MRTHTLHLASNEDVLKSLQSYATKNNISGYILGVVGDLNEAVFQCPGKQNPTSLKGHLEVITLNGTVDINRTHLHLSVSDSDCNVWGGHLEYGSSVKKGLEILVGIQDDSSSSTTNQYSTYDKRIQLMVIPNCAWCNRAIRILKSKQIQFKTVEVLNDELFESTKLQSGSDVFPQIFIDGNYIGGYSELTHFLDNSDLSLYK